LETAGTPQSASFAELLLVSNQLVFMVLLVKVLKDVRGSGKIIVG